MKFKVGDRVAVYNWKGRQTGKICVVEATGEEFCIGLDKLHEGHDSIQAHPKQCRRLVKKERRRVWVDFDQLIRLHCGVCFAAYDKNQANTLVEFVEVKRK